MTVGKTSGGYPDYSYKPIHPDTVWAYVRQIGGREFYASMAFQTEETILFYINWRESVDPASLFVVYKGTWYDVTRIDTYEGYKSDLALYAKDASTPPNIQIKPYGP